MAVTHDEHWMEMQRKRIKEAFALFDKDKKGEDSDPYFFQLTADSVNYISTWYLWCDCLSFMHTTDTRTSTGTVVPDEVSTIMRYLGAYPTEKAMTQEILPDMQARPTRKTAIVLQVQLAASSQQTLVCSSVFCQTSIFGAGFNILVQGTILGLFATCKR